MDEFNQHFDNINRYITQHAAGTTDTEEFVIDTLTELRHLCIKSGLDFDGLSDLAGRHYVAESTPARAAIENDPRD